jgi:chemotaxis protein methyltransferase CheR
MTAAMSESRVEYDAVLALLGRRTGLAFPPARREAAEAGVARAMGRAGCDDLGVYLARLQAEPEALDDLIAELTVGETYFFREPAQFEFLRRRALPDLWRRGGAAPVRAWSAGCASGEEAYSLAIVLEQEGLGERDHVLATDVSRAALGRARRARYGPWSLRGDGASAARPYLRQEGREFVPIERVRRRVTFAYLNLATDDYPSAATGTAALDFIFCRNVLIYFDAEAARSVARRLFECLVPGGWLFTAAADPPLGAVAPFETVIEGEAVAYRRPEVLRAAAPLAALPPAPEPSPPRRRAMVPAARPEPPPPEAPHAGPEAEAERVRALANLDPAGAERACAEAASRHTLSAELHYLHAVLLIDLRRDGEAAQALRRAIYLDRTLAAAHLALGAALARLGDPEGARRAFRNARDLCAALPPDAAVPLADGELAGRLAASAATQLAALEDAEEVRR